LMVVILFNSGNDSNRESANTFQPFSAKLRASLEPIFPEAPVIRALGAEVIDDC